MFGIFSLDAPTSPSPSPKPNQPNGHTLSPRLRAQRVTWVLSTCLVGVFYTTLSDFRDGLPYTVPLLTLLTILCLLALAPAVHETVSRVFLMFAHCVCMLLHGLYFWQGGSAFSHPYFVPILQLLFAQMAFPLQYQLLPLCVTLLIPFTAYLSVMLHPLHLTILFAAVALTLVSCPIPNLPITSEEEHLHHHPFPGTHPNLSPNACSNPSVLEPTVVASTFICSPEAPLTRKDDNNAVAATLPPFCGSPNETTVEVVVVGASSSTSCTAYDAATCVVEAPQEDPDPNVPLCAVPECKSATPISKCGLASEMLFVQAQYETLHRAHQQLQQEKAVLQADFLNQAEELRGLREKYGRQKVDKETVTDQIIPSHVEAMTQTSEPEGDGQVPTGQIGLSRYEKTVMCEGEERQDIEQWGWAVGEADEKLEEEFLARMVPIDGARAVMKMKKVRPMACALRRARIPKPSNSAEPVAQAEQVSASTNILKASLERSEKRQKMLNAVILDLRNQMKKVAAENKVLKLAFDNNITERDKCSAKMAFQSQNAQEMKTKFSDLKQMFDQHEEKWQKTNEDNAEYQRCGVEMKVKYDDLKELYDTGVLDKAEADVLFRQQNLDLREAKARYGILKKKYDFDIKPNPQRQIQRETDMEEFKVRYDVLKESFDDNEKIHDEMRAQYLVQGESMRELRRKYGTLKVHFDKSVEDAEIEKKDASDRTEVHRQMKTKYDLLKKQSDSELLWKSKAEAVFQQQCDETRRMEGLYNTTKLKLDKSLLECKRQEESLAQAASQFKVLGWMNAAAANEGGEAMDIPELLSPLKTLRNQDAASQFSTVQSFDEGSSSSMSNISHDIRTPLTTAISSLGVLLDENVKLTEPDRRDLLSKAYASLQSVLNLVNNILDYEKLRLKTVVPQKKQVNVRRLFIQQIRILEAQTKVHEFILKVQATVPTAIMCDRILFQRVLMNLLENSVQTNAEFSTVQVELSYDHEKQMLLGTVCDPFNLPAMFEHENMDGLTEKAFGKGGASLRLAVCHQLLLEMGGSLSFSMGKRGVGSVFEFQLPAPFSKNTLSPPNVPVMIYDADPHRRQATVEMLRYAGANVLTILEEGQPLPTIVFVTVDSGPWVETVQAWRQQNVLVCMVIPNHLLDRGVDAFPGDAHLRSPIDIIELRELLQKLTGTTTNLTGAMSDASFPTSSHVTSMDQSSSVKKEDVAMLLVEDTPVNHALFLRQLASMGYTNVDSAFNGADAVRQAEMNRYSLILMDCFMPIMDGFEATRKIREMPAHATTPIVAVTADHSSENIRKCRECGMTEFFTKPISSQTWKNIGLMASRRAVADMLNISTEA